MTWKESHSKSQSGTSLIMVLVAIGMMGILAMVTAQIMKNGFGAAKALSNESEFDDMRRTLKSRIDCNITANKWIALSINPFTCTDVVPLFDKDGNVVVSNQTTAPTKLGSWTIRAVCVGPPSGLPQEEHGIEVQAARPLPGIADPLHNNTPSKFLADTFRKGYFYSWSAKTRSKNGYGNSSSIFQTTSRLCKATFETATSAPLPQPIKCIVATAPFTRGGTTLDADGFRSTDMICPNNYPVAMSANPPFNCLAVHGAAAVFMGSNYPRSVHCVTMFFRDIYTPATNPEAMNRESICASHGLNPDISSCSGVCCTFNN